MKTLHLPIPIHHSLLQRALLFVTLAFACCALPRIAKATLGSEDTAYGNGTLHNEAGGDFNSAFGSYALFSNTTGFENTATGAEALYYNNTGYDNTATGDHALFTNTTGYRNTATGVSALGNNTTGYNNVASGWDALSLNVGGHDNLATGFQALTRNNGSFNVGVGSNAGVNLTSGNNNTAVGVNALHGNTTGSSNTALGTNAGGSLTTGNGNVCIGTNVLGVAGESNTTRIRNVHGSTVSGLAVYIDSAGKLGHLPSSRRFKEEIKTMDKSSETILALKPVTFRYKKELDATGTKQFGLVAEEVEKVNPDLVTRDEEGKLETVRYEAVNAMLLNEFLKDHRTVQELKSKAAKQEASIAQQQKQIEALTAGLQKVSAQLELSKSAPQTVKNNP